MPTDSRAAARSTKYSMKKYSICSTPVQRMPVEAQQPAPSAVVTALGCSGTVSVASEPLRDVLQDGDPIGEASTMSVKSDVVVGGQLYGSTSRVLMPQGVVAEGCTLVFMTVPGKSRHASISHSQLLQKAGNATTISKQKSL